MNQPCFRRGGGGSVVLACGLALALLPAAAGPALSAEPGQELLIPNVFADIAEQTLPSVVAVYVRRDVRAEMEALRERFRQFRDDPRFRQFFEGEPSPERDGSGSEGDPHSDLEEARTSGSGVIIAPEGYIVTNNHIVGNAQPGTVSVVLHDDTEVPADKVQVIAQDEYLDLAVLKIDPAGLTLKPLPWGDSDQLRIGEWVLAIGNPLELRGSVSKGIISAKNRKIQKAPIEHLLQTDAMINPGNSGGALVNLRGELIGINMAIATRSGFFEGIGFAIPSNDARFITDQVIQDGRVRRGYIGIYMTPLADDAVRQALGVEEKATGIVVMDIVQGAPADRAGVRAYDVITAVDGVNVEDNGDLLGLVAGKRVGDVARLTILRRERGELKRLALDMQVTERPPDGALIPPRRRVPRMEPPKAPTIGGLGLELRVVQEGEASALVVERVEPGSPAARAGLLAGDVLLDVNRTPVMTLSDYAEAVGGQAPDRPHLFRIQRSGRDLLVGVPPAAAP